MGSVTGVLGIQSVLHACRLLHRKVLCNGFPKGKVSFN